MTILQIIVPVFTRHLFVLEECLRSIKACTPVDHVVKIVTGGIDTDERMGEVIAISRSVNERFGMLVTPKDETGYNSLVSSAFEDVIDFPYSMVIPATHRIADKEWFGKAQLPLIRAPTCGMVVLPDDLDPCTSPSFVLGRTGKITSKVFMTARSAAGILKSMRFTGDDDDFASEFSNALTKIGSKTWVVPSCRVWKVGTK